MLKDQYLQWKIGAIYAANMLYRRFFISTFVIISIIVSLTKQGNEKRDKILEKANAGTFGITVAFILLCAVDTMVISIMRGTVAQGMNPFITLTIIAVFYMFELIYHRKTYTDNTRSKDSESP